MRIHLPILLSLGVAQGVLFSRNPRNVPKDLVEIERSIEARDWAKDIWEQIQDTASCSGCQAVLLLLKGLAALGDGIFVKTIQDICKLSNAEDDDVCEGAIALEGPIIASSLRKMDIGSKSSELFCLTFMGLCEDSDLDDWSIPFPSNKPPGGRPAPSGQDPIKIVHYSDIHVDPLYVEGSSTDCGKPICCRPYEDSDKPGNTDSPAGPNGDHKCDAPISLEESMYRAIEEIVPDAAFALFTGDIIDHAVWNTSESYNEAQITDSYGSMANYLGLVYGTAGNHEQHPTNAFQPKSLGDSSQWLYNVLSGLWSRWLDADASADAQELGAFSAKYPHGNLRIISLNTNMYYRGNYWLYQKSMIRDPSDQIAWLVKELDAAEKAGEHVYIIGHMGLGDKNTFHDQSNYLDQIVNRYSATIAAMFFGHTHVDHFQISYSDYSNRKFSNALVTSYIGPSLVPTSGMPSFRVYDVDPVTFAVLDATTYMADMDDQAFQSSGPVWKKYYSAKEAYGPHVDPPLTDPKAELTPAFWHNVTEAMESDSCLWEAFLARKSRGWKDEDCTGDCKAKQICQLRAARSQDNCYEAEPGINFKKRSENRHEERDECGVSVSRATFGALVLKRDMLDVLQERFVEGGARLRV